MDYAKTLDHANKRIEEIKQHMFDDFINDEDGMIMVIGYLTEIRHTFDLMIVEALTLLREKR